MSARTHCISAVTRRHIASIQRRLNEPVIDQALKTILCPTRQLNRHPLYTLARYPVSPPGRVSIRLKWRGADCLPLGINGIKAGPSSWVPVRKRRNSAAQGPKVRGLSAGGNLCGRPPRVKGVFGLGLSCRLQVGRQGTCSSHSAGASLALHRLDAATKLPFLAARP